MDILEVSAHTPMCNLPGLPLIYKPSRINFESSDIPLDPYYHRRSKEETYWGQCHGSGQVTGVSVH